MKLSVLSILVTLQTTIAFRRSPYNGNLLFKNSKLFLSSHSPPPPKPPPRAKDIEVPTDKLFFSFVRSSGPGGQNVNKLNTKAELRFNIDSADWIPFEVKQRY